MRIDTQFAAIFGLRREHARSDSWRPHDAIWDCAALGFKGIFSAHFFLSNDGRQRWLTAETVLFPNHCCACEGEAKHFVNFRPFVGWPFLYFRSSSSLVRAIPHCDQHGRRDPFAFARVWNESSPYMSVQLFSQSRSFLKACLSLNAADGDFPPPWETSPNSHPATHFKQGTNETWMRKAWSPFWSSLSPSERAGYFARWPPPRAWLEHLTRNSS